VAAPRLVILIGSSGVGKSTLARSLQELLLPEQWLHFSVDSIFYCLPPSIVERADRHNDWSAIDGAAVTDAAHACAQTLLRLGHPVIFDAVVMTEKGAARMLETLGSFDPILVELTCSWEEIEKRTRARGDRTLAEAEHSFRNTNPGLKPQLRFDTSRASPNELALQLAAALRNSP